MIKIRMSRGGRKSLPIYTIVAADARSPRDGRFMARLGQYNPHATAGQELSAVKTDEIKAWLDKGAQMSDTVRTLLKKHNIKLQNFSVINQQVGVMSELKELIEYVSKALVDMPDQVEVNEIAGEQTTVIELKVDKTDLGKVIGKQGRTARALRTILNAASTKLKKRSVLEIIE